MTKNLDIAWAAGLFEGEGCIAFQTLKSGSRGVSCVNLGMTDEDVVRRFHAVVGVGSVYLKVRQNPRWQDLWVWKTTKHSEGAIVIEMLLPYFGARRTAAAQEALAYIATSRIGRAPTQVGDTCPHGHLIEGDNVAYFKDKGIQRVRCRKCRNAAARRHYSKANQAH